MANASMQIPSRAPRTKTVDVKPLRIPVKLFKEAGQDDLSGAATELAYKLFLALFPFMIFLTALGGFSSSLFGIADPTTEIMDSIGPSIPDESETMIRNEITSVVDQKNTALLSFGIVGTIWSASSAMGAMMKGLNRIYEVKESRSMFKRYGIALALTASAGLFIVVSVVIAVAGQAFGESIAGELGMEGTASLLFTIARWPVAAILLMTAVALLYWAAPDTDLPLRWISPGAIMFVLVWIPATFLFGLYVSNFGSYSGTYGALGGVVVLLVWLYLTSYVLLLGAELNDVLIEETAPAPVKAQVDETDEPAGETRRRGRLRRMTRWIPEVAVTAPFAIAVALKLRHDSKGRQAA
jgi:membrane protein